MSTHNYIDQEVTQIIQDKTLEFPKNIAMSAAWVLAHYKGSDIKVLDFENRSSLASFFVLGSASNATQARAMAESFVVQLKKNDIKIISSEGSQDADWILVDTGDVMVHIFLESTRTVYDLDTLYARYPAIEIPESYYFSKTPEQILLSTDFKETQADDKNQNYF